MGRRDPCLTHYTEMLPVITPWLWRGLLGVQRQLRKNRFRSVGRPTDMTIPFDGDRRSGAPASALCWCRSAAAVRAWSNRTWAQPSTASRSSTSPSRLLDHRTAASVLLLLLLLTLVLVLVLLAALVLLTLLAASGHVTLSEGRGASGRSRRHGAIGAEIPTAAAGRLLGGCTASAARGSRMLTAGLPCR
ncbi:hypothetical protein BM536_037190 [Streptomyces phaeoluteigriseus]|uniref:Uncharacterized protein n=1 Tax=Streptomyces phaeoluteigriseus TaxID=114686 RepID=A0A1V6MHY7_9ACTN|nr:hypothetical protein [Streptomyces phaeoluteigriseus]OQD51927.1 hypothetical protein BM536_037190 [Streptomyces phaeoluteigriseus]